MKCKGGKRGMALLFCLTSALDGGGWPTPRPSLFSSRNESVEVPEWAPWSLSTGAENRAPNGIRAPDRRARSESMYRLRYPATLRTPVCNWTTGSLFYLTYIVCHFPPLRHCACVCGRPQKWAAFHTIDFNTTPSWSRVKCLVLRSSWFNQQQNLSRPFDVSSTEAQGQPNCGGEQKNPWHCRRTYPSFQHTNCLLSGQSKIVVKTGRNCVQR
jgi:hypothetical protein